MIRNATRALIATVVLAVITGLAYPLLITGVGQLVFHHKAEGSIVTIGGKAVASELIGQKWEGPQWFYGRPSSVGYDASTSSGSNLGPTSQKLADQISERARAIIKVEGPYISDLTVEKIPVDLLLASASGLDPDISPAAAQFQAARIASVRHISIEQVRSLIRQHTRQVPLNLFSAPRVNVLALNLALERMRA